MIQAKVIADSLSPQGNRITSMVIEFPRYILAEFNTHRMFSRNSASSRAIPFNKVVKMVQDNPFIPIAWQKEHTGMQGTEYIIDQRDINSCIGTWLQARDGAIHFAKELSFEGKGLASVTKQLCNRLLEPFTWHKVLVTSTEWNNFWELRCPQYEIVQYHKASPEPTREIEKYKSRKDVLEKYPHFEEQLSDLDWLKFNKGQADIHMMALAEAMWDARNESTPKELKAGEWHIPFGDNIDVDEMFTRLEEAGVAYGEGIFPRIKVATARCARTSYNNFGETSNDYLKDIELHDKLLRSKHLSPFEHCARAMSEDEYVSNLKGRTNSSIDNNKPIFSEEIFGWCKNFRGFIQYRALVE